MLIASINTSKANRDVLNMEVSVTNHYDILIDEDNDPVHDPKPLKEYMDKWDGQAFLMNYCCQKKKMCLKSGWVQQTCHKSCSA